MFGNVDTMQSQDIQDDCLVYILTFLHEAESLFELFPMSRASDSALKCSMISFDVLRLRAEANFPNLLMSFGADVV